MWRKLVNYNWLPQIIKISLQNFGFDIRVYYVLILENMINQQRIAEQTTNIFKKLLNAW